MALKLKRAVYLSGDLPLTWHSALGLYDELVTQLARTLATVLVRPASHSAAFAAYLALPSSSGAPPPTISTRALATAYQNAKALVVNQGPTSLGHAMQLLMQGLEQVQTLQSEFQQDMERVFDLHAELQKRDAIIEELTESRNTLQGTLSRANADNEAMTYVTPRSTHCISYWS